MRLVTAITRARGSRLALVGALVVAAVGAPLVLSDFSLQLTALFLPLAMLALSVDILWGENRLVSFGHGAFFAAGGYIGALVLLGRPYDVVGGATSFLQAATDESPLERVLAALHGIAIAGVPLPALLLPPLITGAAGLLIGLIVFRVASPEVYLPLVTLGIGVVANLWFNDVEQLGASNGLGGVPTFTAELTGSGSSPVVAYAFNGVFVALAFGAWWRFRRSARGRTWRALGDDPVRLEALGYPVRRMRAYGFAVSTALAGLASALYAATTGFVGPTFAGVAFSAQALIWVAVGGVGTVLGPLVGTLLVKWGEQVLSSNLGLQESWQLFLGLLLILAVLVAPGGLMGAGRRDVGLRRLLGSRRRPPDAEPPTAPPAPSSGQELERSVR